MRVCVLASGSKGNALVVQAGGTTVLVDCGLTPKVLRARLKAVGLELSSLDALLITHAHADHVVGALRLGAALRLPSFATRETQRQLSRRGGLVHFRAVQPGVAFSVGDITVKAVGLPHDAPGTVAYVLEHEGERFGVCTDLGYPDLHVARALGGCDTLYLEFNHDEDMLWNGPYPPRLKRRVASDRGHLSNRQAAAMLADIDTSRLRRLLLAHLSEVNNTPTLAIEAAKEALQGTGIRLMAAPQYEPTRWLEVAEDVGRDVPPLPVASSSEPVLREEDLARAVDAVVLEDAPERRLRVAPVPPMTAPRAPVPMPAPERASGPAVREHIVRTLRGEAPRPRPQPVVASVAVKRQLSLFGD